MTAPVWLVLAGVAALHLVTAWLLFRSRDKWPALPDWTWKEIRQLVALIATVAGAAVLTALAWWLLDLTNDLLVKIVVEMADGRASTMLPIALALASGLVWGLKLLLAGVLLVILSLGLVIGPRVFGFKGPGGTEAHLGGGEPEREP